MMSWKITQQEYLERNKWLALRRDQCITDKGVKIDDYYVMELPDVASVVAITKDKKIILVKEYKHGVQKEVLQLPSGYIDPNETPEACAKRELLEETGYTAKRWTFLGKLTGSPGRLTHYYHLFLAEDAEKIQEQKLEPSENVKVHLYNMDEAEKELKKQQTDLVTPAGLLLAKEKTANYLNFSKIKQSYAAKTI